MATDNRLTPALVRALRILEHGPARYSNSTDEGSVYWQSADTLDKRGFANIQGAGGERTVAITVSGRIALERLDTKRR